MALINIMPRPLVMQAGIEPSEYSSLSTPSLTENKSIVLAEEALKEAFSSHNPVDNRYALEGNIRKSISQFENGTLAVASGCLNEQKTV